jgi:hypothetical protein
MSAAALATGPAFSPRRPRTKFRVEASVKKSLLNIQRKAERVWNDVRSMQKTIDELRAENARLRGIIDGTDTDMPSEYNSDDSRPDKFLERNYNRIGNSRFFAARQSSTETD